MALVQKASTSKHWEMIGYGLTQIMGYLVISGPSISITCSSSVPYYCYSTHAPMVCSTRLCQMPVLGLVLVMVHRLITLWAAHHVSHSAIETHARQHARQP
jgi:hypothetical protein